MPKLVKACATVDEFEALRTSGPNAGVGSVHVVKTPNMELAERDEKRHKKWATMLNRWNTFSNTKLSTLKSRVRKGIPDSDRRSAWNKLVQVHVYIAKYPGLYERLANIHLRPEEKKMIEHFRNIELDLYRTFPEMVEFDKGSIKGERTIASLRRVLRAYAKFDEECGYCQSLNFLVGTLLLYLPEREAFWHLVLLMQRESSALRGMYRPGMSQTVQMLVTLDGLIDVHIPLLAAHWRREDMCINASMFATEWYMTLFTRTYPVEFTARVIECFLSEGVKVLHRVSLALLLFCENEFLVADMGHTMAIIRNLPKIVDADRIITLAFTIKLTSRQIEDIHERNGLHEQ